MRIEVDLQGNITKHEDAPIIERTKEEIEAERISLIKSKAREIITSKYSIEWQLNHPRLDEIYIEQYKWIDRIRTISNEAELNGTQLGDIVWE